MNTVLKINGLSKSYGKVKALNNLSLQINLGEVFGILGPNGSGKTTTLGIILDVLKADSGTFSWNGKSPTKFTRKKIGALLETPNFYPYLTARQNLSIVCKIKQVDESDVDRVLTVVNLIGRANSKFKTFSLGMKQRLAIASALLGNLEILVLDEPTNGLDPQGIAEIRTIIKDLASQGKTIIMASHILDEVEKVCTHVAVLKQGNLLTSGSIHKVLNKQEQVYVVADDLNLLKACLRQIEGVNNITSTSNKVYLTLMEGKDTAYLNKCLFDKGIILSELGVQKSDLESNFLELIK
ncbi:MAG: ATP-binding cassette domain-containing protein [Flavobacteriales bacterium]|nr:ATP-binding cassette domain-containing protein [Flavobacteriales bacterium]MCB9363500.1 ATP-binding cassette domain-containing protein [Flavobacteriales bacterium]